MRGVRHFGCRSPITIFTCGLPAGRPAALSPLPHPPAAGVGGGGGLEEELDGEQELRAGEGGGG